MVQAVELTVVVGRELRLPDVGQRRSDRGHALILQPGGGVGRRIVALACVGEVGPGLHLQLEVLHRLPFGKGRGDEAGVGDTGLGVV